MGVQSWKTIILLFLANFCQNVCRKGPSVQPGRRSFKNLYVPLQFCVWANWLMGRKDVLGQKPQCHAVKNGPRWAKMALFSHKMAGHRSFCPKMSFCPGDLSPRCRTTIVHEGFENSSIGPQTRAISVDVWTKVGQKGGNGSAKKRGIFFAYKFLICIRCRIKCRLWFCHRTWPNSMR